MEWRPHMTRMSALQVGLQNKRALTSNLTLMQALEQSEAFVDVPNLASVSIL